MKPNSIQAILQTQVAGYDMDAKALTFYVNGDCVATKTYGEYLESVAGIISRLRQDGIKKGDKVATLMTNRLEVPLVYLAVMSLGAVVVPLNPDYSATEMDFVIKDAGVRAAIVDQAIADKFPGAFDELYLTKQVADLVDEIAGLHVLTLAEVKADDPAIILYTSGTTSFPKGVVQMHKNLIENASSMIASFRLRKPTQYSILPFYHSHSVGFGMMTCLLTAGHLIIGKGMDPRYWLTVVQKEHVTVTSMVPNLLNLLVHTNLHRDDVPDLEFIFVSAAPLPSALADTFETKSEIRLAHAWGLSEYTNFATTLPYDTDHRADLMFGDMTPCVGFELEGTDVRVVDENLQEVGESVVGQLILRGPSLTAGYYNRPDATADAIKSGWLHSGDLGYYRNVDGRKAFFITDRIKDVIIRSGQNISPAAIEKNLSNLLSGMSNSIVAVGYPHGLYGEEIGLVVETDDFSNLDVQLRTAIMEMPVWQRPKTVLYGSRIIERTHTGKIQRRKLRPYFDMFKNTSHAYIAINWDCSHKSVELSE